MTISGVSGFSGDRVTNTPDRQREAREAISRDSRAGGFSFGGQENNFRDDQRQTFVTGDRFGPPTGDDPGFLANVPVVGGGLAISSILQELLGPPTGASTQAGPAGQENNFRDDERNQLLSRAGIDPGAETITPEQAEQLREADRGFERDAAINRGETGLRSAFEREIQRRGLSGISDRFTPLLDERLGQIRGSLPTGGTNFDQFFNPNIAADVLDVHQQGRRNEFLNTLNNRFGSGFELEAVPGTFDDAAIGQLVDSGLADAMQALDRSRARGQLTDSGFNRAAGEVRGQAGEARTQLDTAGQSVLADLRNQLRGIADQARSGASNFTLGGSFEPTTFFNEADAITSSPAADIAARIRSQVPVEGLFDPQSAITLGGSQQGLVNPGRNALIGAFANRVGNDREQQRGVGSRGTF